MSTPTPHVTASPNWRGGTRLLSLACALAMLLFSSSCKHGGEETPAPNHGASGAPAASGGPKAAVPPGSAPRVLVVEVGKQVVPIVGTYPAQTAASQVVDVRPRVEGYLMNFDFQEGSLVSPGQSLFQIDPAPFEATLQQAIADRERATAEVSRANADVNKANADLNYALKQVAYITAVAKLTTAKANLRKADEDVARYVPLAKIQAVPRQTLDYALASQSAAKAEVQAQEANVVNARLKDLADIERARASVGTAQANVAAAQAMVRAADATITRAQLNLGYTHIDSPIRGIIGKLAVTPGNLVGKGEATLLASIDALDPLYVNFPIAEVEWLQLLGRRDGKAEAKSKEPNFELLLADGSVYPYRGRFGMIERGIKAETGTISLRTIFPNPQLRLRAGQFARIRVITDVKPEAMLIPQRAVMEFQSLQTVFVVDADNKVVRRTVSLGERVERNFIVQDGLKPGDKVIVEGLQKVRPGAPVIPETVPIGSLKSASEAAPSGAPSGAPAEGK